MDKICTHIGILKEGRLLYNGSLAGLVKRVDRQVYVRCVDAKALAGFL